MEIKIQVRPEVLKDLLVTAIEGGINYWAAIPFVERDANMDIVRATIRDVEADEEKVYQVTPETVLLGLQRLGDRLSVERTAESWHFPASGAGRVLGEVLSGGGDASTADLVLQMGVFGEVLYS